MHDNNNMQCYNVYLWDLQYVELPQMSTRIRSFEDRVSENVAPPVFAPEQ